MTRTGCRLDYSGSRRLPTQKPSARHGPRRPRHRDKPSPAGPAYPTQQAWPGRLKSDLARRGAGRRLAVTVDGDRHGPLMHSGPDLQGPVSSQAAVHSGSSPLRLLACGGLSALSESSGCWPAACMRADRGTLLSTWPVEHALGASAVPPLRVARAEGRQPGRQRPGLYVPRRLSLSSQPCGPGPVTVRSRTTQCGADAPEYSVWAWKWGV